MERIRRFVQDVFVSAEPYMGYRSRTHLNDELVQPLVEHAFGQIGHRDLSVIELGCGFRTSLERTHVRTYVGVDISLRLLAMHNYRGAPNASFVNTDLDRPGILIRKRVDFVLGALVLNYLVDPAKTLDAVRHPETYFCFVCPNPAFDERHGVVDRGTVTLSLSGFDFRYFHYSMPQLQEWIGATAWLRVIQSAPVVGEGAPPYVCFFGRW